jgi:hypothetical protein
MYNLQEILLENYCKKNSIKVISKETDRAGVLFYNLCPRYENGEIVSYPYITAQELFPERFGLEAEEEMGNWSTHCN